MDAWLEVDQDELKTALTSLHRVVTNTSQDVAYLHYEDGYLMVRSGGSSMGIGATGDWAGMVVMSALTLARIGLLLPRARSPLRLEVDEGKLRIGTLRLPCEWTVVTKPPIELTAEPDLLYGLAIKKHYSDSEIRESRLDTLVDGALARRDDLLEKAALPLAELGITLEMLRALVDQRIPEISERDELSGFGSPQASLPLDTDVEQLRLADD